MRRAECIAPTPRSIPRGMQAKDRRAFGKIAARARIEAVHMYAIFGIGATNWHSLQTLNSATRLTDEIKL